MDGVEKRKGEHLVSFVKSRWREIEEYKERVKKG
jgi:hypothetical protein